MACVQRMINSAASTINRRCASSPISYRSFCSGSSSDNALRSFNVDTFAMVNALKAQGIPLKHAKAVSSSMSEVLAELEKNPTQPSPSLQTKFEALRKSIKKMRPESTKEVARVQHSLENRGKRHLIDELTLESRHLGQRIDQEFVELRRQQVRSLRYMCFLMGGILAVNVGVVVFEAQGLNELKKKIIEEDRV